MAKRNGDAFIVNHCIPINPRTNDTPINDTPHVNDVTHYRQPAHLRKRQLHSVWTTTAPSHPQESAVTTTAHRDSQGQAPQTEPLTRQCAHHRKRRRRLGVADDVGDGLHPHPSQPST
ncbi:MAG: hypothetical protein IKZ56_01015 [Bacteroidales bacterium]|nr:hypothetical protein [Bacteroidales bacterium]